MRKVLIALGVALGGLFSSPRDVSAQLLDTASARTLLIALQRGATIGDGTVVPMDRCTVERAFGKAGVSAYEARAGNIQESGVRPGGDTRCTVGPGATVRVFGSVEMTGDVVRVHTVLRRGGMQVSEQFILTRNRLGWLLVERRQYDFIEMH
jgi:hypothetical protein